MGEAVTVLRRWLSGRRGRSGYGARRGRCALSPGCGGGLRGLRLERRLRLRNRRLRLDRRLLGRQGRLALRGRRLRLLG